MAQQDVTGLNIEVREHAGLALRFIKNGQDIGEIACNSEPAARLVCQILGIAKQSQELAGIPLSSGMNEPQAIPVIQPSKLALGPSPIENHHCIILVFGAAQFGVSLNAEILKQFAEALTALAATGKAN